jgi:hypothetical protein
VSCPERKENEEAEVRDVKDATADDLPGFDALVGAGSRIALLMKRLAASSAPPK